MNSSDAPEALMIVAILVGVLFFLAVLIGVYVLVARTLSNALKALPETDRKCNPVFPWLVIIPLAGLVFHIICLIQIPASFAAHFGEEDADAKSVKTLGIVSLVLVCCSIIPCVGGLAAIGYLVVYIMFVVKVHALGKRAAQD